LSPFIQGSEFAELTFCQIFLASFVNLEVLNEDTTVSKKVLDPPTTVSHPLSWESATEHINPKKTFASIKRLAKYGEIRERAWQTHFWQQ
jgi:hypothetical protein